MLSRPVAISPFRELAANITPDLCFDHKKPNGNANHNGKNHNKNEIERIGISQDMDLSKHIEWSGSIQRFPAPDHLDDIFKKERTPNRKFYRFRSLLLKEMTCMDRHASKHEERPIILEVPYAQVHVIACETVSTIDPGRTSDRVVFTISLPSSHSLTFFTGPIHGS